MFTPAPVDNQFIADFTNLSSVNLSSNPPAAVATQPATAVVQPTTNTPENPFDLFQNPLVPPAAPMTAPVGMSGSSQDFFAAPFPAPTASFGAATAAAPLLPPPSVFATSTTGGNTMSEADFDAFFESLNKK